MWKVGGIKIESAAGRQNILPQQNGNSWKMEFFFSSSYSSKTKRYYGAPQKVKRPVHIREQTPFGRKLATGPFLQCFACPKLKMPVERELPAYLWRCLPILAGHNFDLRAKSSREDVRNVHKKILSIGFCSKVKIVTSQVFGTLSYFCWQLVFNRHLPTSKPAKHGQNGPAAIFVNKAFVAPYVTIISPVGPIPISLFVFELEAEE